jgi:hypothetical protein
MSLYKHRAHVFRTNPQLSFMQNVIPSRSGASTLFPPGTVRESLVAFVARTRPQELMITSQIFDHTARLHSYKITAQVADQL